MNLFDCFLIAVLTYSTIVAFVRGIILELFSLGGLIAGILLASWNYKHVATLLGSLITAPATAEIVAFFLIIIAKRARRYSDAILNSAKPPCRIQK